MIDYLKSIVLAGYFFRQNYMKVLVSLYLEAIASDTVL